MSSLSPLHWLRGLKRKWLLYHLGDERFRFMWDPPPPGECVGRGRDPLAARFGRLVG